MRLFTGIDIPADVMANLEELLQKLRPTGRLKWSPVENLHITTKFIGEWPAGRLDELKAALAAVERPGEIHIKISGLGWFPNPHVPRVFWAGIRAADALAALARATDQATARLGVPNETKPYAPHLTLARIKSPVAVAGVQEAVAGLSSVEFGSFTARRFLLYRSERESSGSTYHHVAEFPLV